MKLGDRLNTDIAFALNCKIISLLLLSGVTKSNYFHEDAYIKGVRPNYVMSHLGKIYETLGGENQIDKKSVHYSNHAAQ